MATDPREVSIALLRSIDASLKTIARAMTANQPASAEVASDDDMDGKYGDPDLKFKPRDWNGPFEKGQRFSECPAELLDLVAESCEYFAKKAEEKGETTTSGKPVAPFRRKDAARARGWAKRIRAGWKPATGGFSDAEPVNGNGFIASGSEWADGDDRGFEM